MAEATLPSFFYPDQTYPRSRMVSNCSIRNSWILGTWRPPSTCFFGKSMKMNRASTPPWQHAT